MATRLVTKSTKENKESMCRYVVGLFCRNVTNNSYERKDDCIMTLNLTDGAFELTSVDKTDGKYTVYARANVTKDNMHIISRELHKIASMYNISQNLDEKEVITFDYEIRAGTGVSKMFGIRFDPRSSASERNFYTEFTKIKSKY